MATSDRADVHDSTNSSQEGLPARYFAKPDGTLGKRDASGARLPSDEDRYSSSQQEDNSFYEETTSPLKSPRPPGAKQGKQEQGGDNQHNKDDDSQHNKDDDSQHNKDDDNQHNKDDEGATTENLNLCESHLHCNHQPSFSQEASQ
jgi:hypothetical protein